MSVTYYVSNLYSIADLKWDQTVDMDLQNKFRRHIFLFRKQSNRRQQELFFNLELNLKPLFFHQNLKYLFFHRTRKQPNKVINMLYKWFKLFCAYVTYCKMVVTIIILHASYYLHNYMHFSGSRYSSTHPFDRLSLYK